MDGVEGVCYYIGQVLLFQLGLRVKNYRVNRRSFSLLLLFLHLFLLLLFLLFGCDWASKKENILLFLGWSY